MKMPTHEAARSLAIHPANLILYLSYLGVPFEECWPTIDDAWIKTLKQTHRNLFVAVPGHATQGHDSKLVSQQPTADFTMSALKVLDKLHRKKHWGGNGIGWRTLHNNYCHNVTDLREAVEQLQEHHLLLGDGEREPISLNPAAKREIDELVESFRSKKSE